MIDAYSSRGVSSSKSEVKEAIKGEDSGIFPGAFCKIYPDIDGDPSYCSALHADGAGTKSSLAYLVYKETGDVSVFSGIARDSAVMNIDDLCCIGATDNFMLSNTIGRNAHRVGGESVKAVIRGYREFSEDMAGLGINIILSGGETADVGDLVKTVIADSTVFCRMRRVDVVDCSKIKPGLLIIGLASFGRASYEDVYNSGMGSNGLTLARHLMLDHSYFHKYPETYSETIKESDVYSGKYKIMDKLDGSPLSVGEALLSPTRTYLPVVKKILSEMRRDIFGIIHCTGGGQCKCRNFSKNIRYVKDSLFDIPPLFRAIYSGGEVEAKEMYQDFNMGHRMEIYAEEKNAERIIEISRSFGVDAKVIGHTEFSNKAENELNIRSELGDFYW